MSDVPAPAERAVSVRRAVAILGAVWSGARQFFFGVLPAAGIAVLLFLLVREMRRDDIEVAPIAVPARLAEAGLTSEVIALRLLDQLAAAARAAQAESLGRPTTELAGTQPDFAVPIAGLSLRSAAQLLRGVFNDPERRVTGEIVLEPNERLSLRLRLSGHGQVADLRGYAVTDVDGLLRDGAPQIWRPLAPRLYAWWVADNVRDQAQVRERLAALRRAQPPPDAETDRTIAFLTARSLVRSRRSQEALPIFETLVADHPNWPGAWSGRAMARAGLNRASEAVEDLRRAVALDPGWVAGHAQLASVLAGSGRAAEALDAADRALALDPEDLTALSAKVRALRDLRRMDEALAVARRLVLVHPDRPGAQLALGHTLLRRNDRLGALAAFDAALELEPGDGEALAARSETLLALNRAEEALAAANAAAAASPGVWTTHNARGLALRRLGRHEESLDAFDRAVQASRTALIGYYNRALALTSLNRTEEAVAALRELVAMDRENVTNARRDLERLEARSRP